MVYKRSKLRDLFIISAEKIKTHIFFTVFLVVLIVAFISVFSISIIGCSRDRQVSLPASTAKAEGWRIPPTSLSNVYSQLPANVDLMEISTREGTYGFTVAFSPSPKNVSEVLSQYVQARNRHIEKLIRLFDAGNMSDDFVRGARAEQQKLRAIASSEPNGLLLMVTDIFAKGNSSSLKTFKHNTEGINDPILQIFILKFFRTIFNVFGRGD
ncbi:MAG: hypothetical protein AAB678_02835 [Patescibacteria group bacterium]|mgnify:CR=1 FL=1